MVEKVEVHSATIIGGTGSLGSALLEAIAQDWPSVHVTVLSRDEHKQATLKRRFPKVNFIIADVRNQESLNPYVSGRDIVFHVAAMKHVDIIEKNPVEAIKTNVLGTINVANSCLAGRAKHVIYSSTDKAVDPINAYGYSKALGEKVLFDLNAAQSRTKFSVYRWGNVLGSQGSAIPYFIKTLKEERRVYLTHPEMTRFWLPIEWAVRYMLRTFSQASPREAMIPPVMKSASVMDLCSALSEMIGVPEYERTFTGIRPGEKLHEVMYSTHSGKSLSSETAERYTSSELKTLLAPIVEAIL